MEEWIERKLGEEKFTLEQKKELVYTVERYDLPKDHLELLFDPRLDAKQIGEIRAGMLESSLNFEQVQLYARPEIDWYVMWELRKCLLNGMDDSLVSDMIEYHLNEVQIKEILAGFKNGISVDSLRQFVAEEKGMA